MVRVANDWLILGPPDRAAAALVRYRELVQADHGRLNLPKSIIWSPTAASTQHPDIQALAGVRASPDAALTGGFDVRGPGAQPCGHIMHRDCLVTAAEAAHTCPVCRAPVAADAAAADGVIQQVVRHIPMPAELLTTWPPSFAMRVPIDSQPLMDQTFQNRGEGQLVRETMV